MNFADCLEKATIETIEDGVMTGDLYLLSTLENKKKVNRGLFHRGVMRNLFLPFLKTHHKKHRVTQSRF